MTSVIYISRTGMLEPLGQSQVLAYLKGLSTKHEITLISFERDADLLDRAHLSQIDAACAEHGIRWIKLRYRQKPRILASTFNLIQIIYHTAREVRSTHAKLIHARSYIPAAAAWAVSRITGTPYVFDMRSLWPEELITSGRMRRGSFLHKLIFKAERRLLSDAKIVVSLTQAGARYLQSVHPDTFSNDQLRVIPTCADLDRFTPAPEAKGPAPLIGCHGSLNNGWFRVDLLAKMFDLLAARLPQARFEIITREDPAAVLAALSSALGVVPDWYARLTISRAKASEIHERLQRQSLSMFFYASGAASELGRSPTRMGESLGCGVPVLANEGVGDVAETIRQSQVGYVIDGEDEAALRRAADAAIVLLRDPDIAERCRQAAEKIYSLDTGVQSYQSIYHQIESDENARVQVL
ncbi:glycosyltransferase [Sphingomonas sp. PB4P5]|uniref:glycosyltransferase n=1 Tax=Parasphingomonas puruogangriensis TaxID=3096155 RepID=UPI002FC619FB